jgi:hypothetical protein
VRACQTLIITGATKIEYLIGFSIWLLTLTFFLDVVAQN